MPRLEWSVLVEPDNSVNQTLVDMFKKISPQAEIQINAMLWEHYKQELTSMAIYGRGADVSQVGAPLVSDLAAMNALHSFTEHEMAILGGRNAFSGTAWKNSIRSAENKLWAIPLVSDPFTMVYWSDMLEKAGVDRKQAFTSEHIEETFERLRASGIEYPLLVDFNSNPYISIHMAASWIWAQDTDFVSDDGTEAIFVGPAALAGLKAYYRLARFVSPICSQIDRPEYYRLFAERRAAVTMSNFTFCKFWQSSISAELRPLLRVARPPGPALIGGSNLVIWNASHDPDLAFDFVKFLVSPEVQAFYPLQVGEMPVRQEVLRQPPYTTDPLLQSYVNILKDGRVFPLVKFSGLLEDRLSPALTRIWYMLLSEPDADLDTILLDTLNPLARHYERIMKSNRA